MVKTIKSTLMVVKDTPFVVLKGEIRILFVLEKDSRVKGPAEACCGKGVTSGPTWAIGAVWTEVGVGSVGEGARVGDETAVGGSKGTAAATGFTGNVSTYFAAKN